MNEKLKQIAQKLAALVSEERSQLERIKAEGRELEATETEAYEKRAAEIDKLEVERTRLERLVTLDQRNKSIQERLDKIDEPERPGVGGTDHAEERANFKRFLETGEKRGLVVSEDKKGGYLASKDFRNELIKGIVEFTPFRQYAKLVTTTKTAVQFPVRKGSFSAVWSGEEETQTESTGMSFGLEEIPTHKLRAMVEISSEMLEDGEFDAEAYCRAEASEQFALADSVAFFTGNGVKKPWGVCADTAITNTKSGSNGDFDGDDLIDLLYDLPETYRANAAWFFNRKTLKKIRKMKVNNEYVWAPTDTYPNSITKGLAPTILGQPYMVSQQMADTGTTGNVSVIVGDYRRGYLIVDRVEISVLRDVYTKAAEDVVRLWFRKRTGGQVILAEAIRRLEESA